MAHPNKHIRAAIAYAIARGWRFEKAEGGSAHVYGTLKCGLESREGCTRRVHGTPRNPESHARKIVRAVNGCPH